MEGEARVHAGTAVGVVTTLLSRMPATKDTPAMQQYARFKAKHPDCVLLFRIGDFYEMFNEDAVRVSRAIGLTLTQRSEGVPMAGLPFHQLESYLRKLLQAGFRVAVCEQLVEASQVKGVVPRAVTRVITPGTLVDDALLESESPSALAAVAFDGEGDSEPASAAVIELSTGVFTLLDVPGGALADELVRRGVRELVYPAMADGKVPPRLAGVLAVLGLSGTPRPPWQFRADEAERAVREHFGVSTLDGFGLQSGDPALRPAGAALQYLKETQTIAPEDVRGVPEGAVPRATLRHLRPPRRERAGGHLVIDAVSLRALEVERAMRGGAAGSGPSSLLSIFTASSCATAMGKRLLRDWLCRPLTDVAHIRARQDVVGLLAGERALASALSGVMGRIQDVARIAGRLALGRASPRDLVGLARSVMAATELSPMLEGATALAEVRERLARACVSLKGPAQAVLEMCVEEPPPHLREGGLIRDGADAALDECRLLERDAGSWLAAYQGRLISEHNLPSLKVGFNRVFGYYIELPAAQAKVAPAALTRTQTLRNAERFTTPELRDFEKKVTSARANALERERELAAALTQDLAVHQGALAELADAVAELDVLCAFADKAHRRRWVRPEVVDAPVLRIMGGRHPVLDELLEGEFVPNDVTLGGASPGMALITGPNMAGKSTYIRQVALLTLLAHTGSFVPADEAVVGVADRIFTRIGADDALHQGQSTFMVEMVETANILHHATSRSLVVLDEIGRGTSTLDGLSLAWAIAEHLSLGRERPRALFATHYHELTTLEEQAPGKVQNLQVLVREWPPGDEHASIVFLHRIEAGRADKSYGVQVARLAGIPSPVIARAREVLASLSVMQAGQSSGVSARETPEPSRPRRGRAKSEEQLGLFTEYVEHPALTLLREAKLETLSPIAAFDLLRAMRAQLDADGAAHGNGKA